MNAFNIRKQRWQMPLMLLALLGTPLLLAACGGSDSGDSEAGTGGGGGSSGNVATDETALDSATVLASASTAAALSNEDLSAAIAAADLDLQMSLAQTSGLTTALGGEAPTRALLAILGREVKATADSFAGGGLFATPAQSPRARAQAAETLSEAFGAGWFGGSLFNAFFVQKAASDYGNGKSGPSTDITPTGDVTATAGLSDTLVTLDATANFSLNNLSATIKTHSGIPCPDATGLWTINSSLDVTGKAGNAYQSARFNFELIVEVDEDAKLTGRNQLKSSTKTHTANSANGYDTTDASANTSITQFADGSMGDASSSYKGMSEKDSLGWMNMGMMSGILYRAQVLPSLQKMLDAGRCVGITVEPSAGPLNLAPFTNVTLLTKPRAKTDGLATAGTVLAKFKRNAGGSIVELGSKVPADATFHYLSPFDYAQTEVVTFESRSKRGTGKLDYTLTTGPHAD